MCKLSREGRVVTGCMLPVWLTDHHFASFRKLAFTCRNHLIHTWKRHSYVRVQLSASIVGTLNVLGAFVRWTYGESPRSLLADPKITRTHSWKDALEGCRSFSYRLAPLHSYIQSRLHRRQTLLMCSKGTESLFLRVWAFFWALHMSSR